MPVDAQCRCGRQLRARDNMAGKKVRCPDCGGPVQFPRLDDDLFDDDDQGYDDYGYDDDYDDNPYADDRRRPASSRGRSSGSRKKTKSGLSNSDAMKYGLIGGGVLGGIILLVTVISLFMGGGGDDIAQNAPGMPPSVPAAPGMTPPAANGVPPTTPAMPIASASPDPAAHQAIAANTPSTDPAGGTTAPAALPASTPAAATGVDSRLWVVLSNFRSQSADGIGLNQQLTLDYRIADGQPDPAREYVMFISQDRGSVLTQYVEVPFTLSPNGSVSTTVGGSFTAGGAQMKAYVAYRNGPRDWKPVSGEITVGGGPTNAQRPPTVAEQAGATAQGKLFALADAKKENDRFGRSGYTVSYVLQGQPDLAFRYFLILEKNGQPNQKIQTDLTFQLSRMKPGEEDKIGITTFGPGGQITGPFTMYVEKRQGFISREPGEVVSNRIPVQE